jgi:hypothetical protein
MKRVPLALAAVITDTSEGDNPLPEFLRFYRLISRRLAPSISEHLYKTVQIRETLPPNLYV